MPISRRWKGKEREIQTRDEGPGAAQGIVLPLDVVGSGVYDVAYTIPVKFGDTQQFSLQIDTGSSDLWVASKGCSSSSCSQTNGRLYDPSGSRPTGKTFSIPYLQGSASGPIVWDEVTLGGYAIDNQALAAANDVEQESLAPNFSGILGLALPLNSIIASEIPPVTGNAADGAAWASNLFSITPVDLAPASRFLSLALSRPGSDEVPAVLGIGRHPASLVPDPSLIQYAPLVSERSGTLFWKASVTAITVYVNGTTKPIAIGKSSTGAVFPSAVLDSGVPLILTTSSIANAIYGALGVTPASDGTYYVPCTTPLNMTITLDTRPETPLHPLDLTAEPPTENQAQYCIGLIQPADAQLTNPASSIGDMILGVPFLRNIYTVMAYTLPNPDGSFPVFDPANQTDGGLSQTIRPRLGVLPLTNPTKALQEFNTVRVLNKPISSATPTPNTGSSGNTKTVDVGGKKLSVGIVVLIGLLSFFALCCGLFAVRWFLFRRKFRNAAVDDDGAAMDKKAAYRLARRRSSAGLVPAVDGVLTEDQLREMRFNAFLRKEKRGLSDGTMDSDRTLNVGYDTGKGEGGADGYKDEFGLVRSRASGVANDEGVWDPQTGLIWGDDTLVGGGQRQKGAGVTRDEHPGPEVPLVADQDRITPPSSPEQAAFPHHRNYSDPEPALRPHKNMASVDIPLLPAQRYTQEEQSDDDHSPSRFSAQPSHHARLFSLDQEPQHPPQAHDADDLGELGLMTGTSMAGVGTASRMSKFGGAPLFRGSIDSAPFHRDSLMSLSSAGTAVYVGVGGGRDSGAFSPVPGGSFHLPTVSVSSPPQDPLQLQLQSPSQNPPPL